jgi:hypothetical protein
MVSPRKAAFTLTMLFLYIAVGMYLLNYKKAEMFRMVHTVTQQSMTTRVSTISPLQEASTVAGTHANNPSALHGSNITVGLSDVYEAASVDARDPACKIHGVGPPSDPKTGTLSPFCAFDQGRYE